MLHVDYFRSTVAKRGRSQVAENPSFKKTEVEEALLVLINVEKQDESHPEDVSKKTVEEVIKLGQQLKVETIVLHPFAHLFGEPSQPEVAIDIIKLIEKDLIQKGFRVTRTPFGWFNTWELRTKGHPLARVARKISVD
ncbi:MAG: threonyl-tRNA synthetase editing domain-containing protein [Candidatus Jordarchaeum sp.]|uniref:threonyl-tRNA synthetase editing domain-containing protein n=1 Tax=Candidatus Jordarchaeum sp. TaxID=2823881 RepID=UPI0040495733